MKKPQVAVVIVNYNGVSWLPEIFLRAINSVLVSEYPSLELILVDNHSTDASLSLLTGLAKTHPRQVRIAALPKNIGYAGGNNHGARAASNESKYIFFLNNDAVLESSHALGELVEILEANPQIAAVQPMTVRLNTTSKYHGHVDTVGYLTPFGDPVTLEDPPGEDLLPVTFPHGAAFIIRREVFEKIGGFAESYFSYYEDADLGWRLWMLGFQVVCSTNVRVLHMRSSTWRMYRLRNNLKEMRQRFLAYRNLNTSMLVNYEWRNILRYALPRLFLGMAYPLVFALGLLMRRETTKLASSLAYFLSCVVTGPMAVQSLDRRLRLQTARVRKDSELLGSVIVRTVPSLPLPVIYLLREVGLNIPIKFYLDGRELKVRIE